MRRFMINSLILGIIYPSPEQPVNGPERPRLRAVTQGVQLRRIQKSHGIGGREIYKVRFEERGYALKIGAESAAEKELFASAFLAGDGKYFAPVLEHGVLDEKPWNNEPWVITPWYALKKRGIAQETVAKISEIAYHWGVRDIAYEPTNGAINWGVRRDNGEPVIYDYGR